MKHNLFVIERGILKQYNGTDSVVHIPKGVCEIGYRAFYGCKTIQQVRLPEGVQKIGLQAFAGCNALQEIVFPDSLCVVGWNAFADTPWLQSQPDGIVYMGPLAFCRKGELQTVAIRPGTVKLCADLFRNSSTLIAVQLPDTLREIDDRAFQNCRKLKQITIPPSVQRIGDRAFEECLKIEIQLESTNVTIGRACFPDNAAVHITGMHPADLPDNVRRSAVLAFADDICRDAVLDEVFCRGFLKYLKSRRKQWYDDAMQHWNLLQVMLQQKIIPADEVDAILDTMLGAEQAEAVAALMQYQQQMNAVEESDGFDSWDAFSLDWDLSLPEKSEAEIEKEWGIKKNTDGTCTLVRYYGAAVDIIVPDKIGDLLVTAIGPWALSPGRYGIKRETAEQLNRICSVTIPEGITRISNNAFAHCAMLNAVILPDSLVEIGYEAFYDCNMLIDVVLPDSVEKVGRNAFENLIV